MAKTNVLLVNPRYNGRSEIPPLGLEYLAAPLLADGMDVSILDLDIFSEEEGKNSLSDRLRELKPQILGVTAMSHSFSSALEVCETAKTFDRNILTVMGGIHATVMSDKILREHGDVDVCIRGEGERTFHELVNNFTSGHSFAGIEGLSYREGSGVVHNNDRALEKNLDELREPVHHLVYGEKYRTRSISSSRGCQHNCSFCSIRAQYGKTVRTRSAKSIANEIRMLVEGGAQSIMFTDDNFTGSAPRIRELCSCIERLGLSGSVEFYAEGRIDDICRNPIMASLLGHAGFKGLYIGAESGSPEVLDYYNKGIGPDHVIKGVALCIEQDLMPVVNFILFGPRDTIATMKETIRLARRIFEMGAEIVYAETLIPYPGTSIQKSLARDGMFEKQRDVYFFRSYNGLEMDWFLRLCNIARAVTDLLHRKDKYLSEKKAYFELGYLDELLSGHIPARFEEVCRQQLSGKHGALSSRIKEVHEYITATIGTATH
ncbi:MAG TPA: radical SAM protein [Syntrophales bacterium]|nr:radical SAM protein [Syntrophales bacterium]